MVGNSRTTLKLESDVLTHFMTRHLKVESDLLDPYGTRVTDDVGENKYNPFVTIFQIPERNVSFLGHRSKRWMCYTHHSTMTLTGSLRNSRKSAVQTS
jgi:hypothetical protein